MSLTQPAIGSAPTTPPGSPLPPAKHIVDILGGLLGREVTVSPGIPVIPRLRAPVTTAVYTDRHLTMRAVIVLDLALSSYVGCALGLFAGDVATDFIQGRDLPPTIRENLHEVLNVLTGVFNVGAAPHLSLYQVVPMGELAPVDVSVRIRTLGRRLDLAVEVQGYGPGALSVICV